jgi:hypothetical protein
VPSDALTTTAGHAGQVFGATVPAGQELLIPMLTAAGAGTSVLAVPHGDQAESIGACVTAAVAGYITAGSLVDVYAIVPAPSRKVSLEQACSPDHEILAPADVSVVQVVTSILVLSATLAPGTASPGTSSVLSPGEVVVTLAATTSQAEQLFRYSQVALPGLTLLPPS